MKFDVFGKRIQVVHSAGAWTVYYLGEEGRKRPADDILIPPHIQEAELEQYLDDLCHEWATEKHFAVKRII